MVLKMYLNAEAMPETNPVHMAFAFVLLNITMMQAGCALTDLAQ